MTARRDSPAGSRELPRLALHRRPHPCIPFRALVRRDPQAWALFAVSAELSAPRVTISGSYGPMVTDAFGTAATVLSALSLGLCLLAIAMRLGLRMPSRAAAGAQPRATGEVGLLGVGV